LLPRLRCCVNTKSLIRKSISPVRSVGLFFLFVILVVSFPLIITIENGALSITLAEAIAQFRKFISSIFDGSILTYAAGNTRRSIGAVVPRYFLNSLLLSFPPSVAAILLAVAVGRRRLSSSSSHWLQLPLVLGILPSFVVAVALQFLAVQVYQQTGVRVARVAQLSIEQPALVLPTITLTLVTVLYLARTVSATVARLRTADFVAFARARGIGERAIYYRHVLPGILADLQYGLHGMLGILFADLFVLERVFRIPGLTQAIFANAISYEWSYQVSRFVWIYQYNLILVSVIAIGALYTLMYFLLRLLLVVVLAVSLRRSLP
jgi:peptide/nickel transport system permease protein